METRSENLQIRHTLETVISIQWWAPTLCTLRVSKPAGYSFQAGHYARLGLPAESTSEAIVWRPYSIVSAPAEPFLEFLITVVPGGALTSRLTRLQPGRCAGAGVARLWFLCAHPTEPWR
ncbi:FAD-binding oxidoreductase [Uliginosibacterium gangwonense]|uniref:FAD-binding oxidoreductase n=1 Tax=Uliginosibacterium gangwonense TaxID=392736 RepID=UPI001B7FE501